MKILMLGWELPPHNSGGLGQACFQMCKSLSKKDIDIEFMLPYNADHGIDFMEVTPATPQGVESVVRSGIAYDSHKYTYVDGTEEWLTVFEQQQLFEKSAAKLAEGKDFDILHAHDWLTFRAALRIKEKRNCPIILHVHSVESDRAGSSDGNPLVKEIEETALNLADKVIAVSEHTKKCIVRDYGVPPEMIEVVHNSIEPEDIVPLEGDNAYEYLDVMRSIGYRVVVNIGRLTVQKGLPNFLRAAQLVLEANPKTLFLIVGSGEQYYELLTLASDLGIGDKVIFTDFQRGKRLRDAYGIGDLFVMPSVSEPFGLTPLEAIGYGTPALVTYQSGISEILSNCLKVDFWDVHEMANKIASVIQNDPLRDELLRNSTKELNDMSWHPVSDKIHGLYQDHHKKQNKVTT